MYAALEVGLLEVTFRTTASLHLCLYEEVTGVVRAELTGNNICFFSVKGDVPSRNGNSVLVDELSSLVFVELKVSSRQR